MTTTLSSLIEQRETLNRQIEALSKEQRAETIEKIRMLMAEGGLTLADLGAPVRGPARASASTGPKNKVAAKFGDKAGNSWSGRGLKPKWLTAALAAGANIDDFKI